jgi:hypothetical protein
VCSEDMIERRDGHCVGVVLHGQDPIAELSAFAETNEARATCCVGLKHQSSPQTSLG